MQALCLILASVSFSAAPGTQPAVESRPNAFFALDTATKDADHQTVASQVEMLKELGYAGWAPSIGQNIPETLQAIDAHGLELFALYAGVDVDAQGPAYDPKLKDTLTLLKGRQTIIWVYLTGRRVRPGDDGKDERAVKILREIADAAHEVGLAVSIYPHVDNYVETLDDAIRLAEKVNRRNLGVTFNLCHFLKVEGSRELEPLLARARRYLNLVTINGADREGRGWDRLIQPLGYGNYDVYALLKTLRRQGYAGAIGFQGYGIKGDMRKVLKTTVDTWQQYARRLAGEGEH